MRKTKRATETRAGGLARAAEIRRPTAFAVLFAAILLTACAGAPHPGVPPKPTVPTAELAAALATGERSAEAVTRDALARIAALDGHYRAVIAVMPDALAQARELDRRHALEGPIGPLHGIPVLLKDNVEAKGLPTTAGSLALADSDPGRDAPLVARLRDAGAVILGKTNLSEWANFRSSRSSSGWSAVGGQTVNAVDPTRTPCGSSAGSAVAVALGYVPLAIGTETNGSIVCPASVNGVVGFKPTVGLVDRRGIVPIAITQDTAGPITRDVRGAWLLLRAMAGPHASDPMRGLAAGAVMPDELTPASPRELRIGVLRSATGYHEGVDALFETALASMAGAGVTIVDDLELDPPPALNEDTYRILLHEFLGGIDGYLATLPPPRDGWTLDELIAFNEANADAEMPWFRQELFLAARDEAARSAEVYPAALERARRATRSDGLDRLLAEHRLDALVAPTRGPAWKIDLVNGDHFGGGFSTYPAVAGYPHLTLPMGHLHGLPIGLSVTGAAGSDAAILSIGLLLEALAIDQALVPLQWSRMD